MVCGALAATMRGRAYTNQLVRKGRSGEEEDDDAGPKSGQGRKKAVAAPQRRGVCTRVATVTPKKPNSLCARSPACG